MKKGKSDRGELGEWGWRGHNGYSKYNAYSKQNKKSQITMFVMLGLVLLIIFILLFSLKQKLKPKPVDVDTILNELGSGRIKSHVTTCMSQVAMEGLEKAGANGGFIYDFEGGNIPLNNLVLGQDYLNHTSLGRPYFVAYGLKKNTLCPKINYSIPSYPYPETKLSDINAIYNLECRFSSPYAAYDGFYGQNAVAKLCYLIKDSGCKGFAKGSEIGFTIQKQLEDYIIKRLPLCVNFSAFTDKMTADITAESAPDIEVNIHDADILLVARYPLKISFEKQEPVTKIISYQATLNVRLGRVYNFLYDILSTDSRDIGFNLDNEFISSSYWLDSLDVNRIRNPCSTCNLPYAYDDIVEVIDRQSLVNGKPFLFRAAVQDRTPALDLIETLNYDFVTTQQVDYTLRGFDPDDSEANYIFMSFGPSTTTGWHESDPVYSVILENLENGLLKFPIDRKDYGVHPVGIIVLDDKGLYDYQTFKINITDSTSNFDSTPNCTRDCVVFSCSEYGGCTCDNANDWQLGEPYSDHYDCGSQPDLFHQPPADYCEKAWCKIAANQCDSECLGHFADWSDPRNSLCWDCVYPIVHAGDAQTHIDCFTISDKVACLNNMPDCFWVKQNISNAFKESCYNDTTLDMVNPPAYILTS
jgi:hypothetical protein